MELPRALLRGLAMAVSFSGLFLSLEVGLTRGYERGLGLRIIELTLVAPEVDSHLQLMLLLRQPKTLSHEACVHLHELFTKPVHRAHRLLKELVVDDALLLRSLEHAADPVLRRGGLGRGPKRLVPFRCGAGAWRPPSCGPGLARSPNDWKPAA